MNYLELCQQVVRDGAIIGGNAAKPDAVLNQTGRMQLVVDWVDRANRSIQAMWNDYNFRSRVVDILVVANSDKVTTTGIERVNTEGVYVRDADDRRQLRPIAWPKYRNLRNTMDIPVSDEMPESFSIDPAGDVHTYPICTRDYVLRVECIAQPQILVNDEDIPWIPAAYHEAIIYRALMFFYAYDESEKQYADAEQQYLFWTEKLDGACLPHHDMHSTSTLETPLQMYTE